MITYLLQVAICWGLFLGLYHLTLRKETFFAVNRVYLLMTIVLGLLIPRVTWDTSMFMEQPTIEMAVGYMSVGIQQMTSIVSPEVETSSMGIVAMIYWLGVVFMIGKLFYGIGRIFWMRNGAELIKENNQTIAYTNRDHAPFTFFGTIYLSKVRNDQDNDPAILIHESAHVSGWHTLDVLFVESVKAFFWFNPLVYGYDHALKTVHEYIADANVLQRTALQRYGRLLLRQAQPGLEIALANHFYNSQLKKRFKMMTRTPSQKRMLLKYLSVLPFILVVSLVFTNQQVQAEISKVEEIDLMKLIDARNNTHQGIDRLLNIYQDQKYQNPMANYVVIAEEMYDLLKDSENNKMQEVSNYINKKSNKLSLPINTKVSEDKVWLGFLIKNETTYYYPLEHLKAITSDYTGEVIYFNRNEIMFREESEFDSSKDQSEENNQSLFENKLNQLTGEHDINWNPKSGKHLKILKSSKPFPLTIYNQYGEEIYKNEKYNNNWNGEFSDVNIIKDGNYFYRSAISEDHVVQGALRVDNILPGGIRMFADEYPRMTHKDCQNLSGDVVKECVSSKMKEMWTNHHRYPEAALKAKAEGLVTLDLIIEKDGSISEIKANNRFGRSHHPALEKAAIEYVEKSVKLGFRYTPALVDGKPVRFRKGIAHPFDLSENKAAIDSIPVNSNSAIEELNIAPFADEDKDNLKTKKIKYYNLKDGTTKYRMVTMSIDHDMSQDTMISYDQNTLEEIWEVTTPPVAKAREIFQVVEEMPQFPGGKVALTKFILDNLKYPKESAKAKVQGDALAEFVIDENGEMLYLKVPRGPDMATKVEALRVISKMRDEIKWIPGKQRGKKVDVKMVLPITFGLSADYVAPEEEIIKRTVMGVPFKEANGYWYRVDTLYTYYPERFQEEITIMRHEDVEPPEDEVFEEVEELPEYPDGEKALLNAISKHLVYPTIASSNNVEGTCIIGFIVEKDGSVTSTIMRRDAGASTGSAANQAVSQIVTAKKWKPGKQNGKPVRVLYNIPIRFKLANGNNSNTVTALPQSELSSPSLYDTSTKKSETPKEVSTEDLTIFNMFSPNGDGINDGFTIIGIEAFDNNQVQVFNKWGNKVFSQTNYTNDNEWEGDWNGKDVPDGTYFYLISDSDKNSLASGYVQILRIADDASKDKQNNLNPLIVIHDDKGNIIYNLMGVNVDKINPNDIKQINVVKGEKATDKYGDKGTNGVVEIYMKPGTVEAPKQLQSKVRSDVKQMRFESVKIFPNPVEDNLTIILVNPHKQTSYMIHTLDGKLVKQGKLSENKFKGELKVEVPANQFPTGILVVTIIEGDKVYSQPIVKK